MTIKTFEEYKLFSNITNISITGLIQYLDEDYGFNTIMNFSGYYDKIIHTKKDYIMALTEYPGPNNYNCMQDEIRFDDDDESFIFNIANDKNNVIVNTNLRNELIDINKYCQIATDEEYNECIEIEEYDSEDPDGDNEIEGKTPFQTLHNIYYENYKYYCHTLGTTYYLPEEEYEIELMYDDEEKKTSRKRMKALNKYKRAFHTYKYCLQHSENNGFYALEDILIENTTGNCWSFVDPKDFTFDYQAIIEDILYTHQLYTSYDQLKQDFEINWVKNVEKDKQKEIIKEQLNVIEKDKQKDIIKEKYKKKHMRLELRIQVWDTYIGNKIGTHKCMCCNIIDIMQLQFQCGHIQAEYCGGETTIDNLRPICKSCNCSMRTTNMLEYMKTNKYTIPDNFYIK